MDRDDAFLLELDFDLDLDPDQEEQDVKFPVAEQNPLEETIEERESEDDTLEIDFSDLFDEAEESENDSDDMGGITEESPQKEQWENMPVAPEEPDVAEVSVISDVAEVPVVSDVPEKSDSPVISDVSEVRDVPEVSVQPVAEVKKEKPEQAEKPKQPKQAKKSKEAKQPEEAKAPKQPKKSEQAKQPKEAKAPNQPKKSEQAKQPKEAKAPKQPKKSEQAKQPKVEKQQKETKAPKQPKKSEEAKQPKMDTRRIGIVCAAIVCLLLIGTAAGIALRKPAGNADSSSSMKQEIQEGGQEQLASGSENPAETENAGAKDDSEAGTPESEVLESEVPESEVSESGMQDAERTPEVTAIAEYRESVDERMEAGDFSRFKLQAGVRAYAKKGDLMLITIPSDNSRPYTARYYYQDKEFICYSFSIEDENAEKEEKVFYLKDGELLMTEGHLEEVEDPELESIKKDAANKYKAGKQIVDRY